MRTGGVRSSLLGIICVCYIMFEPIIAGMLFCIWRWQQGWFKDLQPRGDWERIRIVQTFSTLLFSTSGTGAVVP